MNYESAHASRAGNRTFSMLLAFGLVIVASQLHAESPLTEIRTVDGVSEYRLGNGLKLLLIHDPSVATLTTNVVIRAGSRHESYGETGAAHLLEHLQFKGTARYPDIAHTMQKHDWAGYATTWYETTQFVCTMEGTVENLEQVLRFEADRLTNGLLLPLHLEQEMPVVRNELENSESSPWGFLPPRLRAVSLEWHNYGKATIGNLADLESMPIEKIRSFYTRYYQPDNVTLILAGRFDKQQALSAVTQYWGSIPRPTRTLADDYTLEPAQSGERFVVVRRGGGLPMAGVHYHIPAASHPDFAAAHVLASLVLSNSPGILWRSREASSRGFLHQSLVAKGDGTSVYGSISPLRQRGFLEFYAWCKAASDPNTTLDQMVDAVESISEIDWTERDVRNAQMRLIREVRKTIIELPQLAPALANWETSGDWRLLFLHRDRLEKVQLEDIQRVAAKYLTRANRTAGVYIPESARSRVDMPATPDVAQLLQTYESDRPVVSGEHIEPTPQALEQRIIRRDTGSGTKVVLLPKRTRGDRIRMRLELRFGNATTLRGKRAATSLLARIITSNEAKGQARDGIRGSLAGFSISASSSLQSLTLSIVAEPEYVDRGWAMLTNMLRQPHFSDADFKLLKQKQIASLQSAMGSPFSLANREVQRLGQPYDRHDARFVPTFGEEIEELRSLELADVKKAWEQLVGADDGIFVAIGSFDSDDMIQRVETLTRHWKSPKSYIPLPRLLPITPASSQVAITLRDKEAAAFASDLSINISDHHNDYAATLVAQNILRLTRLSPRLNQDEGLSYIPTISFAALPNSQVSRFGIRASSNPTRLTDLQDAVRAAFDSVRATPFTESEFERAKTHLTHLTTIRLWNDQNLSRTLERLADQDRTLAAYSDLDAKIASLELTDVQAAAEKYLDYSKAFVVMVGSASND